MYSSHVSLVSLCKPHFQVRVCSPNVANIGLKAINGADDIISTVADTRVYFHEVGLSVVGIHALVLSEDIMMLLFLAHVNLLFIREVVTDMMLLVAVFTDLSKISNLHPFKSWRYTVSKFPEGSS